jgi:hypothetical protein
MAICFCPGCYTGNIMTKLEREPTLLPGLPVGKVGCCNGIQGCCLASIFWPLSPFFGMYLMNLRWKFKLFYGDDDRLKLPRDNRQWCMSCCLWHQNLFELNTFVNNLYDEGQLTFKWDFDLYRDQLARYDNYPTTTMFLFCAQTKETSVFFDKLLMHTSRSTSVSTQQIENTSISPSARLIYPPESAISTEIDIRDLEVIYTGIRPIQILTSSESIFLAIWKIPPSKFRTIVVTEGLEECTATMFLLDPHDPDGSEKVKQQFLDLSSSNKTHHIKRNIVILIYEQNINDNNNNSNQTEEGIKDTITSSNDEVTRLLRELSVWASQQHNSQVHKVRLFQEDDYLKFLTNLCKSV